MDSVVVKRKRSIYNPENKPLLEKTAVVRLQRESDRIVAYHILTVIYSQYPEIGHYIDLSETKSWYSLEFDDIDVVKIAPLAEIVEVYPQFIRDIIIQFGDVEGQNEFPKKKKFKIMFEIFYAESQTTDRTFQQHKNHGSVETEINKSIFQDILETTDWTAVDDRSLRVANLINELVYNIEEFPPMIELTLGRATDDITKENIFELKFTNLEFVKYSFLEYLFDMMTPTRLKINFAIKEPDTTREENVWFMSISYMEQSMTKEMRRSTFYSTLPKRGTHSNKRQLHQENSLTIFDDEPMQRAKRHDATNFQFNLYSNKDSKEVI